jgi:RND family efflux transporter MFP subunit
MNRIGTLAVVVCAAGLASCSREKNVDSGGENAAKQESVQPPVVAVAAVTFRDLERKETLAAEFRPFQMIDVHAKVAGYLKEIYVDVGDRVKEGQTLAILEIPELTNDMTRAQAASSRSDAEVQREREELLRAQAARDAAHLTFTRLQGVATTRPNLIAQQEIDDAQAKDQVAEATVSAARAALAASQQGVAVSRADVARTETMSSYAKITAPFAGVITKRYADKGAMIPAGTATTSNGLALVQLSQNALLRLVLPVPEAEVAKVHLGETVDVHVKALDRTFTGKVTRFADSLNLATRTMDTQVDVPNPSLILIPGMYAEAVLTIEKHPHVLSIPLEGVNIQDSTATAYMVGPDHKITIRRLKLGLETANHAEVLSGLSEKDMVVIGNRGQLAAGQLVEPKMTEAMK